MTMPSNAARMADVVRGVIRDHPNSTTAEVVALTNRRLVDWDARHDKYPLPSGAPTQGLRKLERTGKVERLRDGPEPRWVIAERVAVGRWGRLEESA